MTKMSFSFVLHTPADEPTKRPQKIKTATERSKDPEEVPGAQLHVEKVDKIKTRGNSVHGKDIKQKTVDCVTVQLVKPMSGDAQMMFRD